MRNPPLLFGPFSEGLWGILKGHFVLGMWGETTHKISHGKTMVSVHSVADLRLTLTTYTESIRPSGKTLPQPDRSGAAGADHRGEVAARPTCSGAWAAHVRE